MHATDDTDAAAAGFLARVEQHAHMTSRTEARRVTLAVLGALAQSLSEGQMRALLRRLPPDLEPEEPRRVRQAATVDKATFLDTVSGGVPSVEPDEVELQASAVLNTLREWTPQEKLTAALRQLPPDLARLFYGAPGERPG